LTTFSGQRFQEINQRRQQSSVTSQQSLITTPQFLPSSRQHFPQFNQPISVTPRPSLIRPQQIHSLPGQQLFEFDQQRQPKGLELKSSELNSIAVVPPTKQIPFPLVAVQDNQQPDTKCQHPVGGGSYTCISFGHPHQPIFAFHTLHDKENGFVFGTGSGFQNETVYQSLDTTRTRRRIMKKQLEKEFMKILKKKKQMKQKTRSSEIEVIKSKNKRMKAKRKKQERVDHFDMKIKPTFNQDTNQSVESIKDEQNKTSPSSSLQKEMFQTDFDDQEQSTISYQISTTRPKVQPYEYPLTDITPSNTPLIPEETHKVKKQPKRRLPSNFNQLSDLVDKSP